MRKLLAAAVITLGLLALLGAGKGGTYQGGTYGGDTWTYLPGGGRPAALAIPETVTIVFTIQDLLTDDANPASIDTSLAWGRAATAGAFTNTPVAADYTSRSLFTSRVAAADSVLRLGTGQNVASFAYGTVDSSDANGWYQGSGYLTGWNCPTRVGAGPYTINRVFTHTDRRSMLVYIPFEKHIPSGATILDAKLTMVPSSSTTTHSTADSFFVYQDSRATDNKWWTVKSYASQPNLAHSAWQNQISNNGGTWSGSNSDPWVPGITYGRPKLRSWGSAADSTSYGGNIVARLAKDLSIKNCVQSIADGAANNGLVISNGVKTDIWDRAGNIYVWDHTSDARGRSPYVVVTYIKNPAPAQASNLQAFPADKAAILTWAASPSAGSVRYRLYRFFENGDTTVVGSGIGALYFNDTTPVNGTICNYFVKAYIGAGPESAASNTVAALPVNKRTIVSPPYYALWFQDPGASVTSAQLDSLASFDAIVTGPFPMKGPIAEPAYTGMLSALRSRNPDMIVLVYAHGTQIRMDAAADTARMSPYRRMINYANTGTSGSDSLGYVCNTSGQILRGSEYLMTRTINFMRPGCADSVAFIWAEAYEKLSRMSGEYTGLFVDDVVWAPAYKMFPSVLSGTPAAENLLADADHDGTVFSGDADEKLAYQQYHLNFIKALRREFANRGLQNRLIVANSSFGRNAIPAQIDIDIMARVDGNMVEGYNRWWPGNAAAPDTINTLLAIKSLMTGSQISPPIQMFQTHSDSSIAFQSEVFALANNSWVCSNDYSTYGRSHIPVMVRRLPSLGTYSGFAVNDGGASPDTLVATWSTVKAKILLQRNAGDPSNQYAVWPYRIVNTTTHATISQSVFW